MANWTTLKEAIANIIKANGNQEITGDVLQGALNSIISTVGENATFIGLANPSTNPGIPDGPVFYIATEPGVYANFSGFTLTEGKAAILQWNNGAWSKNISGLVTAETIKTLDTAIKALNSSMTFIIEDLLSADITSQHNIVSNKITYGTEGSHINISNLTGAEYVKIKYIDAVVKFKSMPDRVLSSHIQFVDANNTITSLAFTEVDKNVECKASIDRSKICYITGAIGSIKIYKKIST